MNEYILMQDQPPEGYEFRHINLSKTWASFIYTEHGITTHATRKVPPEIAARATGCELQATFKSPADGSTPDGFMWHFVLSPEPANAVREDAS